MSEHLQDLKSALTTRAGEITGFIEKARSEANELDMRRTELKMALERAEIDLKAVNRALDCLNGADETKAVVAGGMLLEDDVYRVKQDVDRPARSSAYGITLT
jgi:hypothetical protein